MKTKLLLQTLATGFFLAITVSVFAPQACGQIFVSDWNNTIRKFDSNGNGTLFANTGLNFPTGVALGADGFLYVANYGDQTIWRFDSNGNGAIFAGIPNDRTQGIHGPMGLAFDSAGTTLYVANHVSEASAYTIYSFSTAGSGLHTGTLFASTGFGSGTGLNKPVGLAIQGGYLYVANQGNNSIVRYALPGGGSSPVTFASFALNQPHGLAFDGAGNLYVANGGDQTIKKFNSSGTYINTFGSLISGFSGLTFDSTGTNLYAAVPTQRIQLYTPTGGSGSVFADVADGLSQPQFIAIKPECAPAVLGSPVTYAGFTVNGTVGCTYTIEWSPNSGSGPWTALTTVTLTTSSYPYVDPTPISGTRFYRAVAQ